MADLSLIARTGDAPRGLVTAGLQRLAQHLQRKLPRLLVAELSDDMKRDLGLLDGHAAIPSDPLRD